ncbi:PREDICTED: uncharacterized protein LOC104779135 [Camelina sativa]|uniref:Uncharacterized protein LOC104779135 n=1 Tax=Camelina sativa TaxID=90675 RepID=A0ABM0YJA4_CAMSA|nr:PREDICTED: uncharacterized protein LOC104779135 [Camelina sativa]
MQFLNTKVVGDDDLDEVMYADEIVDVGRVEDNDEGGIGVEEENCEAFEADYGPGARDDNGDESDADSGDDIWDEGRIPDPLSPSDDDEEFDDEGDAPQIEDPEEILSFVKTFNGPEEFKIGVLRYSLKTIYDVKLYRSQSLKICAQCYTTDVKCPWRCYASYDKKKHKMQVKIYDDEHACVRSGFSKMLKTVTIAWLYRERLRNDPKITKHQMVAEIKREYNFEVTEDQFSKAKTRIMKERKITHEEHFARIWDYQAEIFRSNPGTTFEIVTTPGTSTGSLQRFYRLFICFNSQRDAWNNTCRPIIGINGAFLKWDVKGHLLAVVGRDGDNRIVPIAWAVVEIENDDNWDWFLRQLSAKLDLQDGKNIAIISDKQSGLVKAIHEIIPQSEHRQCARHIMDNWKRNSHDMELQRLLWKIARSYTVGEFGGHMEALRSYNPSAYDSLLKTNPRTWSRAFFRIGSCCNDNLNNLSESFIRTIRLARRKLLLDMLKTRFTKRAHAEIEKMISRSQFCEKWMARHNKHEIRCGDVKVCVDMSDRTCGCRKSGIPCVHAASVIIGKKEKVEDYVVEWYITRMWQLTYADGIAHVQGKLL